MPCTSITAVTASSPSTFLHLLRKSAATLTAAGDSSSIFLAKKLHGRAIALGFHNHLLICSQLISLYSLLRSPSLSYSVFWSCSSSNIYLWNSLLASLSSNFCYGRLIAEFRAFRSVSGQSPDGYTLSIVSKALAELSDSKNGSAVHSLATRLGLASDTVLGNTLMNLYFKCSRPDHACKVFEEIPEKSVASWNSLILEKAGSEWELVKEMQLDGVKPDEFTFSVLLPICASGGDSAGMTRGRQIHGYIMRHGLGLGLNYAGSCLINLYCRCGNLILGRRVFETELTRNAFTWTAMIAGYAENGWSDDALRLFRSMNFAEGIVPTGVTLVTILPVVGATASLGNGKQIHGFSFRHCLNAETSVGNALVDMYSKCGSLVAARHVFDDESWHKDAISWSSIISCFGVHGSGEEALSLFKRMLDLGIAIDNVNAVAILSACSRAGFVKEGMMIYALMVKCHGVIPSTEMCSCLVDMFGRAGHLDQALSFVNSMLFAQQNSSVWGALHGAAVAHGNREIQHLASLFLIETEPENPSHYVSLSNFHASFGRWDAVAQVRKRMSMKGLRKTPGLSWIDVNGRGHCFYASDKSHLCSSMIYQALDILSQEIKDATNFDSITSDVLIM